MVISFASAYFPRAVVLVIRAPHTLRLAAFRESQ